MIEIIGTELYQWDTGRSVMVTNTEVTSVHFANKGDTKAPIMDVIDGQAKIPDYLLQTGKQLCVYAVANGVTVEMRMFSVTKRERPENYIYEEDQRNFIYELITEAREATASANQASEAAAQAAKDANDAAGAASKSAEDATRASISANDAAFKAAQTAKSLMVIGKAEGESITLDDAIEQFLVGCRVFGKSTQSGTPTPDAPVDIVSSVDGDSLSIHVCGKNLFTGWIVGGVYPTDGSDYAVATQRRTPYIPISSPGQKYRISNIVSTLYSMVAFYDADKQFISRSAAAPRNWMLVEPPANAKYFRLTVYENPEVDGKIAEADAIATSTIIEAGTVETFYERGKEIQTATISTPYGLRGIPVSTGGNYIDENGQQWICDEIDFARGVYIQRVLRAEVQASDFISVSDGKANARAFEKAPDYYKVGFCSHAQLKYTAIPEVGYCGVSPNGVLVLGTDKTSLDDFCAWLGTDKIQVLVPTQASPIETPLSAEDLAAYNALHTHREASFVSNDGFAHMEIEYVMDAKKYIDSLVAAPVPRLAAVTLPASKWAGSDSPYSQVVSIPGITPYSKVDLLPSVEQLAIFHNKDLAFVTENEDGVVTVYAIGDKPTNDYTIQVQIAEVKV